MGILIKLEDEQRTQLQQNIATELRQKAMAKSKQEDLPDGVDDSQFIKGTKKTTSLAWAWILILFAAVSIAIWLIVIGMAR